MEDVETLLKKHPNLCIKKNDDGKCKVVCQVTSHEMPCTMKAVEMYINGKKYKYACEHKLTSSEEELRSEYLTEKRGQLFCKLTKRYLNNLPHHIQRHLNGRRFQKALNNLESKNAAQEEPRHAEKMEEDKDTELWIPPDSESESEEIEELDPEFKEEKPAEQAIGEDHDYSFDEMNVEEVPLREDTNEETSTGKKPTKTKLKRSATASTGKSKKKGKKSMKNTTETPKKKRKKQDR